MKKLILALLALLSMNASVAAVPDSMKFIGRGILDREYGSVLMVACTGGWNLEDESSLTQEPDCTEARFVLFTKAADPRFVGAPITVPAGTTIDAELKKALSGSNDYSIRAIHDSRPNQWWQRQRALGMSGMDGKIGAVGGLFMTAGALAGMLVFNSEILALAGLYVGWQTFIGVMNLSFGSAKAIRVATDGTAYPMRVTTLSIKELQNKQPENWSVRPVSVKHQGFRFVMNTISDDDTALNAVIPAKQCRFSSAEVKFAPDAPTHWFQELEKDFFFDMNASHAGGGIYKFSFYDRAKNAPGCKGEPKKNKTCAHYVHFHKDEFFEQALRTSWLKFAGAPKAEIQISITDGWTGLGGWRYSAKVSLADQSIEPIEVTSKDPLKLMRKLGTRIKTACAMAGDSK